MGVLKAYLLFVRFKFVGFALLRAVFIRVLSVDFEVSVRLWCFGFVDLVLAGTKLATGCCC